MRSQRRASHLPVIKPAREGWCRPSGSLSCSCPLVVRLARRASRKSVANTMPPVPETICESRPCKRRRIEQPAAPVPSPPPPRHPPAVAAPKNTQKYDYDMVLDDEPESSPRTTTAVACSECVSRRQITSVECANEEVYVRSYRCQRVVPLSFMRICTSSIPLPPTPPLVSDTPTSPGSPRTPDYSTSDCMEDLGVPADLLRSRLAEAAAALEVSSNIKCNLKKRRRGDGYDDDGKPPSSNLYYSSRSDGKLKSMNTPPSLVYGPGCHKVFCKECIIETQDGSVSTPLYPLLLVPIDSTLTTARLLDM
jgi:hypothetical protein